MVTGGANVESIGERAFYGCTSLTEVTIPDSVTSIGDTAFRNCSSLTSVAIPNSVTTIENGAFSFCAGLTSVTIPNSVTTIESFAFAGCANLTSINIPSGIVQIPEMAFLKCSNLTVITIPDSVNQIGEGAFYECNNLSVYFKGDAPTVVLSGDFPSFMNDVTIYYPEGKNGWTSPEWNGYKTVIADAVPTAPTTAVPTAPTTAVPTVPTTANVEPIERPDPFVIFLQKTIQQIASAKEGATVTIDFGDFNVLTLPVMKQMAKRRDLTIQMKYKYDGKKYEVTFPAGMPIKYQDDIRYYGPLKLTDMANRDGGVCNVAD